jgi:hypothetical protein
VFSHIMVAVTGSKSQVRQLVHFGDSVQNCHEVYVFGGNHGQVSTTHSHSNVLNVISNSNLKELINCNLCISFIIISSNNMLNVDGQVYT